VKTILKKFADGQFEGRLPCKIDVSVFETPFNAVKHRFLLLKRRLANIPNTYFIYINFMEEYVILGNMMKVEESSNP